MITEAIILAGGLGTRLREAVPDLPKAMAEVAGRPFLSYVIDYLRMQGIQRFIFALGYKAEIIQEFLSSRYPTLDYTCVIEEEPLGTGGAIRFAFEAARERHVVVTNGDTLFKVTLKEMAGLHLGSGSECTLALKPLREFDRYGVVETGDDGRVRSFREKQYYESGTINGGLYILDRDQLSRRTHPRKFSFEKDYLEAFTGEGKFYGSVQEGYFIDIGIPEDYVKAGEDLKAPLMDLKAVDKSWTLFLDRDGVINGERVGHYVLHWGEFRFSEGVLEVFRALGEKFGRVVVVTNQRGVGRGLMTLEDLSSIHQNMKAEVEKAGGRIDSIFYCTEKDGTCFFRKPNPGMAFQAAEQFPEIDLSRSIMVGNKPSDMRFGRSAGMFTVFVATTNPDQVFPHPDIDALYPSLAHFARDLQS